jgi:two-component sensor histidine kinase
VLGVQDNKVTLQAAPSTPTGLGMTIADRLVIHQGLGKVSLIDKVVTQGHAGTSVAGMILMLVQVQAREGNEYQY